jgi:RHS repeat-associated protein
VLTYVYDNANRETSAQFGGPSQTPARVDFGYNNRNDQTSVTHYSDLAGSTVIGTTVYSYDPGDRVTAITNKNSGAATISYYDYTYNSSNLVTNQTAVSGTATYTYNYSDGTTTYSYDANGNKTMTGYSTGTGNQLTNDGTFSYTYDNAGNLTEKTKGAGQETDYYTYDNRNRLTSVRNTSDGSTNTFTATYTYDALDDRVEADTWSSVPGLVQTRTSYDKGQAWADLSTGNVVQTRYLYDSSANLVARIDVGTGLRQVFTDRQGSVRDVTDTSGTVLDHIEYNAYGAIKSETGSAYGGSWLYTGLFQDRTWGGLFAKYRVLFTFTGFWMQKDPEGFRAGDANLYRYVGSDPTNATDPTGLFGWGDAFDIAGKIWAVPATSVGLAWGGIGLGASALYYFDMGLMTGNWTKAWSDWRWKGAHVTIGHNAIQFENHPFMYGAITFGNAISYAPGFGPDVAGAHEEQHTYQAQWLGILYIPAHILTGGLPSLILTGTWHDANWLELGPMNNPPVPWPWQ